MELDAIKKALSLGQNFVENQARRRANPGGWEADSREENQELMAYLWHIKGDYDG